MISHLQNNQELATFSSRFVSVCVCVCKDIEDYGNFLKTLFSILCHEPK